MEKDKYIREKIISFKNCLNDTEIKILINKIYEDGFIDGFDYKKNQVKEIDMRGI